MKHKLFLLSILSFLLLSQSVFSQENQEQSLELSVTASKNTYLKGEIVDLTFKLKNKGAEDLTIPNIFYTEDGYLHLYISRDGREFKKYVNGEGDKDIYRPPIQLRVNESIETSAAFFWNQKPDVSGLNPIAARKFTDDRILTDYAFPESGTYFIKASYFGLSASGRRAKIESEPIQITIEEPAGEDLEAWNKIKNKGYIAYFIQKSDFQKYMPEANEPLRQEIEQIFNQHRNSIIARQIGQSLERFKIKEEKRKKVRESFPQRNN